MVAEPKLCGFKSIAAFLEQLTGVPIAERTARSYATNPHPVAGRLPVVPFDRRVVANPEEVRRWAQKRWPELLRGALPA